ncbi:MAG: Hsp70 family protein, partial [Bdellovibrionaceae bacterium]|nr:Hsp70 family protein [Pseudobdellovibrionaceae bacterium]
SEEEIQKAVKEAELRAEEDKAKVETAKQRNDLENLVYQTEKLIKDAGSKLPENDKKSIETVLADAKKVVDNKAAELNEMKTVFTKLQEATHKLSSEMYKQGSTAGGAQGPNSGAAGSGEAADASSAKKDGDDVIDADYKDVN